MLRTITAGVALLGALGVAAPVQAAPPPVPDEMMIIDVVKANGSGCADESAAITVSDDNKAFTVIYSDYLAQVGPKADPTDFRKNCQLAVDIDVPSGFTFAIATADYRGFASLRKGAWAEQNAGYYFQGYTQTARTKHTFKGPMEDEWQRTDKVGIASLNFLRCGDRRFLNINTDLRVNRGSSDSSKHTNLISMDSTDGSIETVYRVVWKKCY
ncbi:DUF4360 domain-containing protein [Actinoplanes sp. NPDC051861]|uniref:DUF4360 domain-containing protein n=1 Tax=Actinoplanes sp. NPDC051861 TaxID=3155170 RepID=UPI003446DFD3